MNYNVTLRSSVVNPFVSLACFLSHTVSCSRSFFFPCSLFHPPNQSKFTADKKVVWNVQYGTVFQNYHCNRQTEVLSATALLHAIFHSSTIFLSNCLSSIDVLPPSFFRYLYWTIPQFPYLIYLHPYIYTLSNEVVFSVRQTPFLSSHVAERSPSVAGFVQPC